MPVQLYPNGASAVSSFGQNPGSGLMGLLSAATDTSGGQNRADLPSWYSSGFKSQIGNQFRANAERGRLAGNQLQMDQEGQRMTNRLRQLTLPDLIKLIQAQARQQTAQISGPGIGQIAPAQRSVIPQQYGR